MTELLNSILSIQANKTNLKYEKTYEELYKETIRSIKKHASNSKEKHLAIEFFEYCLFEDLDDEDQTFEQLVHMMDWLVNKLEAECFYAVRHIEYDAKMEEYLIWINIHWADKVEIKF